jgi:hypothetical protein
MNKKPHISRPCCYYKCSTANSQKRALLRNALSAHPAVSRPQNSMGECGNDKVRFLDASRYIAFSRELPAVAAVHALAEGGHRLVGGAGLSLCVGDLGLLALSACHAVGKRKVLALCDRYILLLNAIKTPYRTHSHRSRGRGMGSLWFCLGGTRPGRYRWLIRTSLRWPFVRWRSWPRACSPSP